MLTSKTTFASPLRYPGGKTAISNFIKLILCQNNLLDGQYIEIYAGGAGLAWSLLFEEYVHTITINDISKPLYTFWYSVLRDTDNLCKLIYDTPVTIKEWHLQKHIQLRPESYSSLELGFSTFFLNRTNRSGILQAGVIGGKAQNGKWKLNARFNKKDLIMRIYRIARYSTRVSLYNLDASRFIENILPDISRRSLVYLDPPYYMKGHELYENHYSHDDHVALSSLICSTIKHPWIVSYDAAPKIIALYNKYRSIQYDLNYSAQERYSGSEIMFFSHNIVIPNATKSKVNSPPHLITPSIHPAHITQADLVLSR